jgi:uncharacterized membrane protein
MANEQVFVYAATYATPDDAQADYEIVKQLHRDRVIGTYDAAVITKGADGKVHVGLHELPTQYGAWSGLAVGALVGLFFPPYLIWEAAWGAVLGGLVGHLWKGLARSDMKEIGDMLTKGAAALVVVGDSRLREALQRELKRATQQVEKEITGDARAFNQALTSAMKELTKSA